MTNPRTPAEALQPCPFCGGKANMFTSQGEALLSHNIVEWASVACWECNATQGSVCEDDGVSAQECAADAWNARAEAKEAVCARCEHSASDHVDGHGCTARLEDRSECECGPFVPRAEAKAADLTDAELDTVIACADAHDPSGNGPSLLSLLDDAGFTIARKVRS